MVFKLPAAFGVLRVQDYSFFKGKAPLSSENQAHFSFHNAESPNPLCFLTKPGLGNIPWDICQRFLLAKLPTDVLLISVITLFQWCLQCEGFYFIFSNVRCLYFLWNWMLWLEFLESSGEHVFPLALKKGVWIRQRQIVSLPCHEAHWRAVLRVRLVLLQSFTGFTCLSLELSCSSVNFKYHTDL